jgi:YrbI family 3-deoxy-D-manno-octulosonate 8-phosphate phosphatase
MESLIKKAKKIKLVISDIDGVWTDGGIYYSARGEELKKFNTRDGMGVQLLRDKKIEVAIITGENTEIVQRRADKLGLNLVFLGVKDKRKKVEEIIDQLGLNLEEVAYIGDDINDLEPIKVCGFTATVADGIQAVKSSVDYVCRNNGGQGAFREFAEFILTAKNLL